MGRPGGGGGSSHRSSGGGHSHSRGSHYSSSHSHSSGSRGSFGGFSSGPRRSGYSRGYRNAPPPPPPRSYGPRYYRRGATRYVGGSGGGCASVFVSMITVCIFLAILFAVMNGNMESSSSNHIDQQVVDTQAGNYFNSIRNSDNAILMYFTYYEATDEDYEVVYVGDAVADAYADTEEMFWSIFDENFDHSNWLGDTFEDYGEVLGQVVQPQGSFDQDVLETDLDWFQSGDRRNLTNSLEKFYDKTGIQVYCVVKDYAKLPGVVINKGNNNTTLKTLIVAVAVIVVIAMLIGWWKKVQKRKKEEAEETAKILNTPLEKFGAGDPEVDDLMSKYDDKD